MIRVLVILILAVLTNALSARVAAADSKHSGLKFGQLQNTLIIDVADDDGEGKFAVVFRKIKQCAEPITRSAFCFRTADQRTYTSKFCESSRARLARFRVLRL